MTASLTLKFNSSKQQYIHGGVDITGEITASGNISASGDITGNEIFADSKYYTNELPTIVNSGGNTFFGITTQPTEIKGTNIKLDAPVTASGNVSASGDFIGTNFTGSSFTGSFVGDGSGLTGLNSGSWDGIFSGSAQITGSLGVTGSVLVDGNVGIGTTSPSSKLHVSSATSTSLTTVGVQTESGVIGNLAGIGFATSGTAGTLYNTHRQTTHRYNVFQHSSFAAGHWSQNVHCKKKTD